MRMAKATKEDIDSMIEYFNKREAKGTNVPCGWRRVVFGCEILINDACDPTERHLAFSPYLEESHVAPEQ